MPSKKQQSSNGSKPIKKTHKNTHEHARIGLLDIKGMNDAKKWLKQQGIKPMRAAVIAVISLVAVAVGYKMSKKQNWVLDLDEGSFKDNFIKIDGTLNEIAREYGMQMDKQQSEQNEDKPPILLANIKYKNIMFENYKYVIDPRNVLAANETQFIFQTEPEAEKNNTDTFMINVDPEQETVEIEHKLFRIL